MILENLPIEEISTCINFNLKKAQRFLTKLYDSELKKVGIRSTQFSILGILCRRGTMTISKFSDFLTVERTTLTRNLRPLERDGLIKIQSGKDKRNKEITITNKGKNVFAKAFPLWQQAQKRIKDEIGLPKFESILNDLNKIREIEI